MEGRAGSLTLLTLGPALLPTTRIKEWEVEGIFSLPMALHGRRGKWIRVSSVALTPPGCETNSVRSSVLPGQDVEASFSHAAAEG